MPRAPAESSRQVSRVPLVGTFNQRTIDGMVALAQDQDQRFLNCTFCVIQNPVTEKKTIYVEKRPGWSADSVVSAGNPSTGLIKTDFLGSAVSAFGSSDSTIYDGQISVGTITGRALHFSETLISTTGYVLIKSSDGTGWYYASDSKTQTAYVGDTTNASPIVTNIASTAGMYSGQLIAGSGITAGTRILTVDSSTQITLNANATATASGVSLTKTPVAKILDADFAASTTYHSAFVSMDGYNFYTTDDGKLRNSDLNSVRAYSSTNFLSTAYRADPPVALAVYKNQIICFGASSWEAFYDAANLTGSPLSRVAHVSSNYGAVNQRAIAELHDDIYYLTSSRYGNVSVVRLRNMKDELVSTPQISNILGAVSATGGQTYLSAFQLGGYNYISCSALTSSESIDLLLLETGDGLLLENNDNISLENTGPEVSTFGRMLVYNVDLNLWSEWDSSQATFITGGSGMVNQVLAASRVNTSGKIYTIRPTDSEVYIDDGTLYTMEIRTSKVDFGVDKRKFIRSITLVADEQSSGTVTLECSDDDYVTWRTLGTFDLTNHKKRINACGSHVGGRAYRLTHTENAPFRAEALEFEYDVGIS